MTAAVSPHPSFRAVRNRTWRSCSAPATARTEPSPSCRSDRAAGTGGGYGNPHARVSPFPSPRETRPRASRAPLTPSPCEPCPPPPALSTVQRPAPVRSVRCRSGTGATAAAGQKPGLPRSLGCCLYRPSHSPRFVPAPRRPWGCPTASARSLPHLSPPRPQKSIRPQVVTTFELPGCYDMWTVIAPQKKEEVGGRCGRVCCPPPAQPRGMLPSHLPQLLL